VKPLSPGLGVNKTWGWTRERWNAVNRTIIATLLVLHGAAIAASADDQAARRSAAEPSGERPACFVEVLYSEELPGAPIFQNRVRARLRVTLADRPPFETTVEKFMPWQVPPPRRGQRFKMLCDPAAFSSFSFPPFQ
jgi:hypothetical protein